MHLRNNSGIKHCLSFVNVTGRLKISTLFVVILTSVAFKKLKMLIIQYFIKQEATMT